MLPVSGAFHTQLVAPAKDMLTTAIKAAQFSEGSFAVYSSQTAQRYPATASAIRALLDQHMLRSEEHTSELQSLMRISYAVFCLKKKNKKNEIQRKQKN